jgi:cellulose synthase/poly-beta-1,6-N-acetylglucosamine synthase-like glycosyltransferase
VILPSLLYSVYLTFWVTVLNTLLIVAVFRFYFLMAFSLRKSEPLPESGGNLPFVSMVVPAYNEAKVLPRSIESMIALDYPKDKIEFLYIYEAKSSDNTEEVIKSYASKDSRVVPVRRDSPRGGKGAAANDGIVMARGEVIGSFDADHSLEPDALKKAVRALEGENVVCVRGRCRTINKREGLIPLISGIERDIFDSIDIYARQGLGGAAFFSGGQAFFKREVFDTLGLFSESVLVEDIDYSLKIHEAGLDLKVDPSIVSWEESPSTLGAWWSQRKRWTRGWMQCTKIHLGNLVANRKISMIKKFDAGFLLVMSILLILMILNYPLVLLSWFGLSMSSLYPASVLLIFGVLIAISPFLAVAMVVVKDAQKGEPLRWKEIPLTLLMWPYQFLQMAVSWVAFEDEFILRRQSEYEKTSRSGVTTKSL